MEENFQRGRGGPKAGVPSPDSLDPRVLSSVLVSLKMAEAEGSAAPEASNSQDHLLDLLNTPEIRALLDAAQLLAEREGLPAHEGLQKIVATLKSIDKIWTQVLLKEGLARLNSQYH